MTHASDLRAWARGSLAYEAATEMLLRGFNGKLAAPGHPWIRKDSRGKPWIDFGVLMEQGPEVSTPEWRFLAVAHSLAEWMPVELGAVVAGAEREHLELMLAAMSHAAGCHEQRLDNPDPDAADGVPLYPWPE